MNLLMYIRLSLNIRRTVRSWFPVRMGCMWSLENSYRTPRSRCNVKLSHQSDTHLRMTHQRRNMVREDAAAWSTAVRPGSPGHGLQRQVCTWQRHPPFQTCHDLAGHKSPLQCLQKRLWLSRLEQTRCAETKSVVSVGMLVHLRTAGATVDPNTHVTRPSAIDTIQGLRGPGA